MNNRPCLVAVRRECTRRVPGVVRCKVFRVPGPHSEGVLVNIFVHGENGVRDPHKLLVKPYTGPSGYKQQQGWPILGGCISKEHLLL